VHGAKRSQRPSPARAARSSPYFYAFGDTDVLGVIDMPDVASAVALSLTINPQRVQ